MIPPQIYLNYRTVILDNLKRAMSGRTLLLISSLMTSLKSIPSKKSFVNGWIE